MRYLVDRKRWHVGGTLLRWGIYGQLRIGDRWMHAKIAHQRDWTRLTSINQVKLGRARVYGNTHTLRASIWESVKGVRRPKHSFGIGFFFWGTTREGRYGDNPGSLSKRSKTGPRRDRPGSPKSPGGRS